MKIIAVEGNIGAGKSTMLPALAMALGAKYILEPVDSDDEFKRLLTAFLNGGVDERNAFQMFMTNQRADMLIDLDPEGFYIIERSLLSDLVFTHATMSQYENTAEEAARHMDCYKHLIARLHDYPVMDKCLYLKTTPEAAYQRMVNRGRAGEVEGTSLEYMQDISAFHDAVLPQVCRKAGTELVTVDWDKGVPMHKLVELLR